MGDDDDEGLSRTMIIDFVCIFICLFQMIVEFTIIENGGKREKRNSHYTRDFEIWVGRGYFSGRGSLYLYQIKEN